MLQVPSNPKLERGPKLTYCAPPAGFKPWKPQIGATLAMFRDTPQPNMWEHQTNTVIKDKYNIVIKVECKQEK